jgi:hypothetical protein
VNDHAPGDDDVYAPPRPEAAIWVPAHTTPDGFLPADLILCHGDRLIHRFVQIGQRLRMLLAGVDTRRDRRDWRHYDHVAVFVGDATFPDGTITPACIEALPGKEGVRLTPLSAFESREYHHVPVDMVDHDRAQAVDYCYACLPLSYGLFLHYLGMVATTLTGGSLTLSGGQQEICSSMAAQALVRGPYIWDRPPAAMMPADLARHFNVRPKRDTPS